MFSYAFAMSSSHSSDVVTEKHSVDFDSESIITSNNLVKKTLIFENNHYRWKCEKPLQRLMFLRCYVVQYYEDDYGNKCEDIVYQDGSEVIRYLLFIGDFTKDTGFFKSGTCMYYQKNKCVQAGDVYVEADENSKDPDGKIPCQFKKIGQVKKIDYEEALNEFRIQGNKTYGEL